MKRLSKFTNEKILLEMNGINGIYIVTPLLKNNGITNQVMMQKRKSSPKKKVYKR